jgi:hypothetical protein
MAPVRGTRPKLGRRPVTPQRVEGDEMEPSVSVPMAKPTHPAEVALAEPAEEPRVAGADARFATPEIALRERSHAKFCDQHGAGCVEPLDYLGVLVEVLLLEAARAPRGRVALDGEQVLRAPGNAVQRATNLAGCDLGVGGGGLFEGSLFGQRDDEVEGGVQALKPSEVHLRQAG